MKKFGLIGHPLSHSYSPEIHKLLGNYEYKLYSLYPNQLEEFMQTNKLSGFNVTIPYKSDVIPFCEKLSSRVKEIGSVNTVIRKTDGSYFGENTDYFGFLALLGTDAQKARNEKALILGSGGTSKTVRAVLQDIGMNPIITLSRTGEDNYMNMSRHFDAYFIINTTPVGMYPDNGKSVINLEDFHRCELVIDMIYNPAKTKLLLQAEKLGIPCKNGLFMLTAQAKKASELFMGANISDEKITEITDILSRKTKNVMLIGMPGCGKTTVGKRLSEITGRPFYDTDELITKNTRMDIPQIFCEKGEEHFRKLETQTLMEISKKSGAVIAAGGGVVTVPENYDLLRQNSTVVLIEYNIDKLGSSGRPLSLEKGVKELFRKRQPLYESLCDYKFYNFSTDKTALQIKEKLKL